MYMNAFVCMNALLRLVVQTAVLICLRQYLSHGYVSARLRPCEQRILPIADAIAVLPPSMYLRIKMNLTQLSSTQHHLDPSFPFSSSFISTPVPISSPEEIPRHLTQASASALFTHAAWPVRAHPIVLWRQPETEVVHIREAKVCDRLLSCIVAEEGRRLHAQELFE